MKTMLLLKFKHIAALLLGLMLSSNLICAQPNNIPSLVEREVTTTSPKINIANTHKDDKANSPKDEPLISEEEHRRLSYKILSEAQDEFMKWLTRQMSFIAVIAILGAVFFASKSVPTMISSAVSTQITKEISKLESAREETIKATIAATFHSTQANEELRKVSLVKDKIKEQLADFDKQLQSIHDEISIAQANLKATSEDFDARIDEALEDIKKINYMHDLLLKSLDNDGKARDLVFETLIKNLEHPDLEQRKRAAEILPQFPEQANRVVDVFIKVLENEKHSPLGALILSGLGELGGDGKVLPHLLKLANDLNSPNILAVIGALGSLAENGPETQAAVDKLLFILDNLDSSALASDVTPQQIKSAVALALSSHGVSAIDAIPQLSTMLADLDWNVRHAAAIALGTMGEAARNCIPILERLKNDRITDVSNASADAITKIQGSA